MRLNTSLISLVICSLLASSPAAAVDSPLLAFCTTARPADGAVAQFYDANCPTVLALELQTSQQAQSAATAKIQSDAAAAQVDKETKKIANLKALLPSGATVPTPASPAKIDPFQHLAAFRELALLYDAGQAIGKELESKLSTGDVVLVLAQADLDGLRKSTLPPETLIAEFGNTSTLMKSVASNCKVAPPAAPAPDARGKRAIGGALFIADSLFGTALKVSQAFQVNLTDSTSVAISTGASETVVDALTKQWLVDSVSFNVREGLPPISRNNRVAQSLEGLRQSTQDLIVAISNAKKDDPCIDKGKAVVDASTTRITALNAAPDALTPSQLLTAMRNSEIEQLLPDASVLLPSAAQIAEGDAKKLPAVRRLLFATVSPVHTGGSIASTRTAFSSNKYILMATVVVLYRLEDFSGRIVDAGMASEPLGNAVSDRRTLDRYLAPEIH